MNTAESPYISREDEEEAKRIRSSSGLGEINYLDDEDIKRYSIEDYGFGLDRLP